MELGPIFRTLLRNKTRITLIGIEVALTLAIVVNCISMILDMKARMDADTGLDEANIIRVLSQPFSEDFREEGYLDNNRESDLDLLRSLPGVKAADAFSAVPLSGSGSSSGWKPLGSEMHTLAANHFRTGVQGVETLGVRLVSGRDFTLADIHDGRSKNVIVTKAYADKLFPEGDALGQQIQGRSAENPDTIVGIIERMHGSWPSWPWVNQVVLIPGKAGDFSWGTRYLIRTEPGQAEALIPVIEERLLESNNGRNLRILTLSEIKADTFEAEAAVIKMFGAVIFLLIFVTALGIIGITSFSVAERVHQIGTRRALGARQTDILRYFLTENWLITTLGLVLGVLLTYGLNFMLVELLSGATLDWRLVAAGVLGMWIVGLGAAFLPALRGARISPAIATRNV